MLREIKLIEILVVISVVNATSGGYSIAMGGQTIISGNISFIGSIGVTFDIPNYEKVYEKFGLTANIISRGKFMTVDKMEEIAQGRCWTGKEAVSHGLVDAIGGLSRGIAIAKFKSNISQDTPVTIVEIGSPDPTLLKNFIGFGCSSIGAKLGGSIMFFTLLLYLR